MACSKVFDPHVEEFVRKFFETGRNQKLSFVVVGRTGAGKSQIINSLIGRHVAEEGHTLEAQSKRIACYKTTKNGVEFIIWDTCGLGDLTQNTDEDYLKEIKQIGKVDLVLFCSNMTATRFAQPDMQCIIKFTQAFGVEMWRKAIIVLTFGNQVCPPPAARGLTSVSLVDYFSDRKRMFKTKYYQSLAEVGVMGDLELHKHVAVVTAGHLYQPKLPDTDDWLQRFWMEALNKLEHSSQAAFIYANTERFIPASKLSEPRERKLDKCAVFGDGRPSVLQYSDDICSSTASLERKQPSISSDIAAKKKLFESLASTRPEQCFGRGLGESRHTLGAAGEDYSPLQGSRGSRVQSERERLELDFCPERLDSKLRKSTSPGLLGKETVTSADQKKKSHTSGDDISITVNEENERGILKLIISAFSYGRTGAQAGEMIGKVFPDYLGGQQGKTLGYFAGHFIALLQEIFLRMNQKTDKNNPQGD